MMKHSLLLTLLFITSLSAKALSPKTPLTQPKIVLTQPEIVPTPAEIILTQPEIILTPAEIALIPFIKNNATSIQKQRLQR